MHRAGLGIAGVTITACALFGSVGAAQTGVVAVADVSATEPAFASWATVPTAPLLPGHKTPRRGGDAVPVFTVDELGKPSISDGDVRALSASKNAYDSGNQRAAGTLASDDAPVLRTRATEHQTARAPPIA
jgi:hypothetical protein